MVGRKVVPKVAGTDLRTVDWRDGPMAETWDVKEAHETAATMVVGKGSS